MKEDLENDIFSSERERNMNYSISGITKTLLETYENSFKSLLTKSRQAEYEALLMQTPVVMSSSSKIRGILDYTPPIIKIQLPSTLTKGRINKINDAIAVLKIHQQSFYNLEKAATDFVDAYKSPTVSNAYVQDIKKLDFNQLNAESNKLNKEITKLKEMGIDDKIKDLSKEKSDLERQYAKELQSEEAMRAKQSKLAKTLAKENEVSNMEARLNFEEEFCS